MKGTAPAGASPQTSLGRVTEERDDDNSFTDVTFRPSTGKKRAINLPVLALKKTRPRLSPERGEEEWNRNDGLDHTGPCHTLSLHSCAPQLQRIDMVNAVFIFHDLAIGSGPTADRPNAQNIKKTPSISLNITLQINTFNLLPANTLQVPKKAISTDIGRRQPS